MSQCSWVQSVSHVRLFATPWTTARRLPCPSPTPRACSNSCPSNWWCHPTISSSVIPFSCLQSYSASGSLPMSQFFTSGGPSIGATSASVLPVNTQDKFNRCLTPIMYYGVLGELESWTKELFHIVILGLHWKILITAVMLLFKLSLKLTCFYIYIYFPVDFYCGVIHIWWKSSFLSVQFIVTHYVLSWVITRQSRYRTFLFNPPNFSCLFQSAFSSRWQPLISFLYL